MSGPTCTYARVERCSTPDEAATRHRVSHGGWSCYGHLVSLCDAPAVVRFNERTADGERVGWGQLYACGEHRETMRRAHGIDYAMTELATDLTRAPGTLLERGDGR